MRILVLQGSFRKREGITDIVLDRFLQGISNSGKDVEVNIEYVVGKDIENCRGCLGCWVKTPGKCLIKDDMTRIVELFNDSDIIIAATPMYVDGMSSYMKKVWERLLPVMSPYFESGAEKVRHRMRSGEEKGLFLISTGAFPELEQFDSIVLSFKRIAYNFKMKYLGQILRPESHSISHFKTYGPKIIEVLNGIERCGEEFVKKSSISSESLLKAEQPILESIDDFIEINNKMWDKMIKK